MCFVGREKESRKIVRLLQQGKNVILTGKYGIGKTALIKHIEAITEGKLKFFFVDFSQTPGCVIKRLSSALSPPKKPSGRGNHLRYKSGRSLIARAVMKDKRNSVLVLDNIAKLTPQKLELIRYLKLESTFQYIAIAESFLPKEDWFLLRAALHPAEVIILQYLSEESTKKLLLHLTERYLLKWSEQKINMVVSVIRGYPRGVYEAVVRELDLREKNGVRQ